MTKKKDDRWWNFTSDVGPELAHEAEFTAQPIQNEEPLKINITINGIRLMTPEELSKFFEERQ